MDRLLLASLAVAAGGLVLLATLAYAVEPATRPLAGLERREGQRVCVEAPLVHVRRTTSTDATRFWLADEAASVPGRAPFPWAATPGDRVRACGDLGREAGSLLLQPDRPGDLRVVRPWDADATPLLSLAQEPWTLRGRAVVVWGTVERSASRDELRDPASDATVPLRAADALPAGVFLRVSGTVEYDPAEARFWLRVRAPEPAAGAAP